MAENNNAAELRKLAQLVYEHAEKHEQEKIIKTAHVLSAARGLHLLRKVVRGLYDIPT